MQDNTECYGSGDIPAPVRMREGTTTTNTISVECLKLAISSLHLVSTNPIPVVLLECVCKQMTFYVIGLTTTTKAMRLEHNLNFNLNFNFNLMFRP